MGRMARVLGQGRTPVRGGFDESGCVVVWEDYPYDQRGKTRDGAPIGRLTCLKHEQLVAFGVARGDIIENSDRCREGDEDEAERPKENERPPEAHDHGGVEPNTHPGMA